MIRGLKWFEAGRIRPVIDRTFALKDAARAQETMEKGQHFGKTVLKP